MYWPSIALAVAGAMLAAGVLCVRLRLAGDVAASELRKLGRIATLFPGVVGLLAVASAAQTFFPIGARRMAASHATARMPRDVLALDAQEAVTADDDIEVLSPSEPLISEREYALATGHADLVLSPLADSAGLVRLGMITRLPQITPFRIEGFAPFLLLQAKADKQRQEDALASATVADLLGQALTGTGGNGSASGVVASVDPSLSTTTSPLSSSGSFSALPSIPALQGITRPILSVAPVPEPASWMTMLMGFAGCGIALRRRRASDAGRETAPQR